MKKNVAEREPSTLVNIKNNILAVWVFGTSSETCERLALARYMPRRIQQSLPIRATQPSTEVHL